MKKDSVSGSRLNGRLIGGGSNSPIDKFREGWEGFDKNPGI